MNSKFLLEKITTETLLKLLADYQVYPYRGSADDLSNEIWFPTVCHGGDSNKLCFYKESKIFYCYTNCGAMSIFDLVSQLGNCTFYESKKIIAQYTGYSTRTGLSIQTRVSTPVNTQLQRYASLREHHDKKTPLHESQLVTYHPGVLSYFEDNVFIVGWVNEGISVDTMEMFQILWYEPNNAIVIPHHNLDGELIGIRRRSFNKEDINNKYMPLFLEGESYAHPLNLNFYGLFQHQHAIRRIKKVVIVESEKSVLMGHTMYGDDCFVIATCGFNISAWHMHTLLYLGVEEVIIGFDKDFNISQYENPSNNYTNDEMKKFDNHVHRLFSLAKKLTPYFTTCVLWDRYNILEVKDSPFDKGQEALELLMQHKINITTADEYNETIPTKG